MTTLSGCIKGKHCPGVYRGGALSRCVWVNQFILGRKILRRFNVQVYMGRYIVQVGKGGCCVRVCI